MANSFNFNYYPEKKATAVERARAARAEKSFFQKLDRLEAAQDIVKECMYLPERDAGSKQAGLDSKRRNVNMKTQKNNLNYIPDTTRILAKGVEISNNTRKTGVNNNDLIIGPAGAGKPRGYIIPYILHSEESLIVADTKGNLCRQYGETAAQTISDNCGHWLYLGTLNMNTANEIAQRLNIQVTSVLNMPLNEAYIIARGGRPTRVEKYDLEGDAVYKRLKARAEKARKYPEANA